MHNGVLLETKTLLELIRHYIRDQVRVFSVFHPCYSDIRNSKISRHFHCCCFENTNGLWFVEKNEINVGNRTKTFKRHLEISYNIYSSFMFVYSNFKKYRFYTGFSRAYLHVVFVCIFVTLNKSI